MEKILGDKSLGITRKKESLIKEIKIDSNDKTAKEIIKAICNLLSGGKESIKKIFSDVENEDVAKIQFSSANYDEDKDKLEAVLNEKILLIEQLKALYDWSVLEEMLKFADADKDGIKRISSAKVNIYNQHKDDLKKLKKVIKNHYTAKDYNDIFRSKNIENNYVLYSGKPIINSKNKVITNCTQAEFCDFLKKNYFNKDFDDDLYKEVKEKVVNGILLPKQVNSGNGVIPYQLKKADLIKMLDNAEKYFEFLKVSDNYGSVKDKIIKLMEFRIPYYIGPINPYHKDGIHCWVERKIEHEKVMPWNFNDVIDVETTREKFITTRTNKCTYLLGEDVLPKESLLYSEFMILNELNNLRFSGKTLDEINSGLKSEIFNHLYKKERKVTINKIKELMKCKGINTEDLVVSGVNGDLKANYKSYLDFNFILGNEIEKENTKNMIEDIIKYIVIFGAEKQVLKEMLKKKFGDNLTNDQIKKIVKLNYKEWGRLSRKLLTGIEGIDNNTGEYTSIIGMMRSTNNIFMELLSKDKYTFLAEIEKNNNPKNIDKLKYEVLDDLYVSPAVKRSLWQTLKITNEVVKIMKHSPKKVFIEMTREHSDNHNQKDSRKEFLKKIYSKLEDEYKDVGQCCDKIEDRRFRSDRIFLYFTQLGRCAYSNRTIDFEDIFNENIYDIDHIYPKSKFYDDGIDNKVLVLKEYNAKKDNKYPLVDELSHFRQERLWKILRQKELISEKKYQRLMRKEPFSDKELSEFIARQLVETSQSAKASAEILKNYLTKNNEETEIVYVKAGNVSRFRQYFDLIKCRDINDFHHAHDAYLNIVVGNVYNTKFTKSPQNFIKESSKNRNYNIDIKANFIHDIKRGDVVAWKENESIKIVKKQMLNNNIQTSYQSQIKIGQFYDQNIVGKDSAKCPIKGKGVISDLSKYGGYSGIRSSYFSLIEYKQKNKNIRRIESVPSYIASRIEKDYKLLELYFKELLSTTEVKILIDKIKIGTELIYGGFKYKINGNDKQNLIICPVIQLILEKNQYNYYKKISSFLNKMSSNKNIEVDEIKDKISVKENVDFYQTLINKIDNSIFSNRVNNQNKDIKNGFEIFKNLSIKDQILALSELLKIFKAKPINPNFSLINGSKSIAVPRISKNLNCKNTYKLVYKSVTGLFEEVIDLNKI
ncbi:MAG: type II CRISPR RNA-guided endonuclease Cas9 [Erysipelotrichaceae bacterium]|nr:type II CRISPR RNA-guided endonuclease Cas9 [Erysipelotrichaceae bacterium]